MRGLIVIISGPSGSGKTTLAKGLIKTAGLKHKLIRAISFTTRPKRSGEKEGKDYFFVSKEQFKQKLKTKKILEWTRYLGYYYATPRDFIEERLKKSSNILLCLDLKGALKIKRLYPENTITIFVAPPSLVELKKRIKNRCYKTGQREIKQRLQLARQEINTSSQYDYQLVNKDLEQTLKEMQSIMLREINERIKAVSNSKGAGEYDLHTLRESFR